MNSIFHRISVRKYEDKPVEKEKIMEILKGRKAIVLLNKSDLTAVIEKEEMEQKTGAPVISISAREETGME